MNHFVVTYPRVVSLCLAFDPLFLCCAGQMSSAGNETSDEIASPAIMLQQAIANQELLLSQHDKLLLSLVGSNHVLLNQVSELPIQLKALYNNFAQPAPQSSVLAANPAAASSLFANLLFQFLNVTEGS